MFHVEGIWTMSCRGHCPCQTTLHPTPCSSGKAQGFRLSANIWTNNFTPLAPPPPPTKPRDHHISALQTLHPATPQTLNLWDFKGVLIVVSAMAGMEASWPLSSVTDTDSVMAERSHAAKFVYEDFCWRSGFFQILEWL